MPRKGLGSKVGHGGPRVSQPGTAHPNRTDMNGPQPIRTAPGQPYGSQAQQQRAQEAVPLPSAGDGGGGGMAAPTPAPIPGQLTGLTARSMRPNEPITEGIDLGPGRGSEALMTSPRNHGTRVLEDLAMTSGDPFLNELARRARGQVG